MPSICFRRDGSEHRGDVTIEGVQYFLTLSCSQTGMGAQGYLLLITPADGRQSYDAWATGESTCVPARLVFDVAAYMPGANRIVITSDGACCEGSSSSSSGSESSSSGSDGVVITPCCPETGVALTLNAAITDKTGGFAGLPDSITYTNEPSYNNGRWAPSAGLPCDFDMVLECGNQPGSGWTFIGTNVPGIGELVSQSCSPFGLTFTVSSVCGATPGTFTITFS